MELLERSLGGLADTLQRNRALSAAERERRAREALEREELGLRREERGARESLQREELGLRREGLQLTAEQNRALREFQAESKAVQARHYDDLRRSGLLDVLRRGVAEGSIDLEKLKAGMADNPMLKDLGVGINFFQVPPAKPKDEQFGWPVVTEEEDPFTGEVKRKTTRRVDPKELDAAVRGRGAAAPESLEDRIRKAKTDEIERQMQEHLGELGKGDTRTGFLGLGGNREAILKELQAAKEKLGGGAAGAGAAAPRVAPPTFNTEAEARAAGHKTGDVVRLVLEGKPTLVRLK